MSDTPNNPNRGAGAAFAAELERDKQHRDKARSIKPLRRVWPFVARYKLLLAAFLFFLVFSTSLNLLLPKAFGVMVDCGFVGETAISPDKAAMCGRFALGDADKISSYFKLAVLVGFLVSLTGALRFYFISVLGQRVVADIRKSIFSHLTTLSPSFYEKTRTGEVLSRLTTDTTLVENIIGSSVPFALRATATTMGAVVLMFLVSWKLTLMVLAIGPVIIIIAMLLGRRIQRLSREGQDQLANASARASESLMAIQTVQAFTREATERSLFARAVDATFRVQKDRLAIRAVMNVVIFGLGITALIGVLWYGATEVTNGGISAGEIVQFTLLSLFAVSGVGFLGETWAELLRAAGASERLMELLIEQPDIKAPENPARLCDVRGIILLDDVNFTYEARPETPALKNISLTVEAGKTVALVGPSGAGKTTLFQLLLRFYDPQSGAIKIDDTPYARLAPQDIRQQFAIVQQATPLFSGSAMENIRYGREGASDEDVMAAAKAAYADEFINNLPKGYQTDLGERAATLSGGQRQRIAIARAILRNAPVLLLDEATSALDAESERAVQRAFESLAKDRTTIVIAHRLATVKSADVIVVMEEGRIVDKGTHEELITRGGLYARLAEMQFSQ